MDYKKKLKILHVNKFYYPWIGGVEKVVQDLAEGLKDNADVKVLACQPKGKTSCEDINGVKVIKAGSLGKFFSMPISFSFFRYFKNMSEESDVVCLHMPFPLADLACFLSRYKGKLVLWWHSDIVRQKKLMVIYRPLMNWLLKKADLIIVATQGHIDGSKYLKPFENKCCIIPFGIDIDDYIHGEKKLILTQNLFDEKNKKILFVGRLVYYKGIEVLIDAFRNIQNGELFIIGEGPLMNNLKNKVKEYGLQNVVHFMSKVNDEDLKSAFYDCDVFVLPSIENSEAFGLVQLEAMVYKKPVVNTNLPTGVPYVSLNNISGLTVTPGDTQELSDAIQKLVDDEKLRIKLGENAFDRVSSIFSKNKMLDGFSNECKNLVLGD